MNLEVFDIIVFITGGILGLIIGLSTRNTARKNTLVGQEKTFSSPERSLQQEMDRRQVLVDDFFLNTEENLATLDKHFQQLKHKLVDGAKQLSSTDPVQRSQDDMIDEYSLKTPEPPKDYSADTSTGTLREDFGLRLQNPIVPEPQRNM